MTTLEPRDCTDTFCTCPNCGLLGHHAIVGQGAYQGWVEGADGAHIDVRILGSPPEGTPYTQRECSFCSRRWSKFDHEVTIFRNCVLESQP